MIKYLVDVDVDVDVDVGVLINITCKHTIITFLPIIHYPVNSRSS